MEKMSWEEFENGLKNVKTVLIPLGSTEEHGPHLPLFTDSLVALELARRLGAKTSIIVAPLIPYGVCRTTASFPGTITISFESLKALVKEVCERFYKQGARCIILLSGHLGTAQMTALTLAAQELTEKFPNLRIAVPNLANIL
ncbi:TPA: creatininase family protein, partial [Candidatus Bathyarchaeota archaeon]|nr:creatininase family protein [Candidatus Bathyarchaeota archaeon]